MTKLTNEEKNLYNQKRKLIYKHMPLNRKTSPIIHSIVDTGLLKLIKNNSIQFISDLYIDYLERLIKLDDINDDVSIFNVYKVYYEGFQFKNNGEFYNMMCDFINDVILFYKKDNVGYSYNLNGNNDFFDNWSILDNKRIFDLRELVINYRGPYAYGLDYHASSVAYQKLAAYILCHDELLLNKEKYIKYFNYLRDNYNLFYDEYIMNDEFYYYSQEVNKNFFNPQEFVKGYNNVSNKRVIK